MALYAQKKKVNSLSAITNRINSTREANESENTSDGTDAEGATNGDTSGGVTPMANSGMTAQNTTTQNDPAKNKKLAEIKMSEPMREMLNFELSLPGVYPGIKTNQFIWIPVSETFYDDMYAEILTEMGPSKFNRYSDFEKNRFYISKKQWTYDINNGVKTDLTVNPIPSMYSEYMKYQLEAERALDQAVIDATRSRGSATGTPTAEGGALGSDAIQVGNALAAKYRYVLGGGVSSYEGMKSAGYGDCWAWAEALYVELTKIGYTCRIIQYNSGTTPNHRSTQYKDASGQWVDYPYRQTNMDRMTRATSYKGGMFVVKGEGAK